MSFLHKITESQRKSALKDIGYTEESLKDDKERLKLWMKGQFHLPPSAYEEPDCFLEMFLVNCKGDLSLAKQKLDGYYTTRSTLPELFSERDPLNKDLVDSADTILLATYPQPTPEGQWVTYAKLNDPDPKNFHFLSGIKRFFLIGEMRTRLQVASGGDWGVVDAKMVTMSHALKAHPNLIREFIYYAQHVVPSRIKGVIFFNAPAFLEKLLNTLIKPLLKKKVNERIFVYSDDGKVLLNHFPKEIIPKDFGGDGKSLKEISDMWLEEGKSRRDLFIGALSEKTNECKRIGKRNFIELEGTFRQLNID